MKTFFSNKQIELYHAFKAAEALGHSLPIGNERELIAKEFLASNLPVIASIGQGIIIDQFNVDFTKFNQTNTPQIDLLIYLNQNPKLTFYGGSNIFLAEGVASVLEVKSNINKTEFDKVIKHCFKVKSKHRQILGLYYATNDPTSGPSDKIPYYLVTFDSVDMKTLMQNLNSEQKSKDINELPDGFFCLNPDNGYVIIKKNGLHPNFGNHPKLMTDGNYLGMNFSNGTLSIMWTILLSQIDVIRSLNFPYKSYANGIAQLMK